VVNELAAVPLADLSLALVGGPPNIPMASHGRFGHGGSALAIKRQRPHYLEAGISAGGWEYDFIFGGVKNIGQLETATNATLACRT
jgi:hypothetical protein